MSTRRGHVEEPGFRIDEAGRRIDEVYDGLRTTILTLDPAEEGMAPGPGAPWVWGGVMDMGVRRGAATLVCLRDGTTSLYVSSGGGIVGGEACPAAVRAGEAFLDTLTLHAAAMHPDAGTSLPAAGRIVLRALTHDGPLAFEAGEDDLGYGRSLLSPVFHAAHEVITQLRLLVEPSGDAP